MTDFYSETVKRLLDLENRMQTLEGPQRLQNIWLKRPRTVTVAANTMDGEYLGYAVLDPTPATTDLNTISNGYNGQVIVLRVLGALDAVTVKDGVGNISLPVSGDILLDDPDKAVMLLYDETLAGGPPGLWIGFCCDGGGGDFLGLSDTPANYAGAGLQHVRVNAGATALEFIANTFLNQTDTPAAYATHGLKHVRVNAGATALEFATLTGPVVINFGALETLTISGGVVTRSATSSFFNIAAETGTVDDLDTINGGSDGDMIVLRSDSGDDIDITEAGNIQLVGTTRTIDNPMDKFTCIYDSAAGKWCEISQAGNA